MSNGACCLRTEYGHVRDGIFQPDLITIRDSGSWTVTILKAQERTAQVARLDAMFSQGPIKIPLSDAQIDASREKDAAERAYWKLHPRPIRKRR
jgi:hypothetical protein